MLDDDTDVEDEEDEARTSLHNYFHIQPINPFSERVNNRILTSLANDVTRRHSPM